MFSMKPKSFRMKLLLCLFTICYVISYIVTNLVDIPDRASTVHENWKEKRSGEELKLQVSTGEEHIRSPWWKQRSFKTSKGYDKVKLIIGTGALSNSDVVDEGVVEGEKVVDKPEVVVDGSTVVKDKEVVNEKDANKDTQLFDNEKPTDDRVVVNGKEVIDINEVNRNGFIDHSVRAQNVTKLIDNQEWVSKLGDKDNTIKNENDKAKDKKNDNNNISTQATNRSIEKKHNDNTETYQEPGQPEDEHIDQLDVQETLKFDPDDEEMLQKLNEGVDKQTQDILSNKDLDKTQEELLKETQHDPEIDALFHQIPDSQERQEMEGN